MSRPKCCSAGGGELERGIVALVRLAQWSEHRPRRWRTRVAKTRDKANGKPVDTVPRHRVYSVGPKLHLVCVKVVRGRVKPLVDAVVGPEQTGYRHDALEHPLALHELMVMRLARGAHLWAVPADLERFYEEVDRADLLVLAHDLAGIRGSMWLWLAAIMGEEVICGAGGGRRWPRQGTSVPR